MNPTIGLPVARRHLASLALLASLGVAGCGGAAVEGGSGVPASGGPSQAPIDLKEMSTATINLVVTGSPSAGTYRTLRDEEATCGRGPESGTTVARVRFTAKAPGPGQLAGASLDLADIVAKPTDVAGTFTVIAPDGTPTEVSLAGVTSLTYREVSGAYLVGGKATLPDGMSIEVRVACGPFGT